MQDSPASITPRKHKKWKKFTDSVWQALARYQARWDRDYLENLVRHERWVAAARDCSDRLGDTDQAIYYWKQYGGSAGYTQVALLCIGKPLHVALRTVHLPSRNVPFLLPSRSNFLWEIRPFDDEANWYSSPLFPPTPGRISTLF